MKDKKRNQVNFISAPRLGGAKKRTLFILFFLSLILVLSSILPLLRQGFYEIHDQTHFERLYEMDKCLKAGQIPCRIAPDFAYGYGYPIFNFYAPLSYYLGELFHLIGFGFVDSIKIVFILSVFLGFLGMFLLSKEFFGFYGGLISGLIYVYTPYRALNLYIRGALSESLALGLVPLMVYSFIKFSCHCEERSDEAIPKLSRKPTGFLSASWRIGMTGKNKWLFLSSLFYALLILSHNLTALIFTIFLLVSIGLYTLYLIIKKQKLHTTYYILLATILGLLISCFFWLPAIIEKSLVSTESMTKGILDYHLHFPKISQLVYSKWTYGGSGANVGISAEDMSFQLGILNWLSIPLAIFLIIRLWNKDKNRRLVILSSSFYLLASIFFITSKSRFLWELLPFMPYIQFPWRFLGWTTFFSSFLIGGIFFLIKKDWQIFLSLATCYLLLTTINLRYFKPKSQFLIDEKSFLTINRVSSGTTGVTDEYFPKWVKIKPAKKPENLIEVKSGQAEIKNLSTNFFKTEFSYSAEQNAKVLVNYIYYPGFKVLVNNREAAVDFSNNRGLITFNLEKGEGKVKIIFTEIPLRKITDYLSLISLFLILQFSFLL